MSISHYPKCHQFCLFDEGKIMEHRAHCEQSTAMQPKLAHSEEKSSEWNNLQKESVNLHAHSSRVGAGAV